MRNTFIAGFFNAIISKRYIAKFHLAVFFIFFASCQPPEKTVTSTLASESEVWPAISSQTKPWSRWWWMGSAVDKENIARLMEEYAKAGIGGLEIAPIYGAMGYEDQYIDFLSPEWMEMLDFTVTKAGEMNMGIDMTLGTGWPFGGPQVTEEFAATKLVVETFSIKAGEKLQKNLFPEDPKQKQQKLSLIAVMAYGEGDKILDITDKAGNDGTLNWTPENGNWTIYAAFAGKTGQMVKRAAPGGAGFTLDHLSGKALDTYLKRFENAFENKNLGIRAFYNDSYEVYGANWSPAFFEEFRTRRGYDLRKHLRELASEDHSEVVGRVKADYRQTMGEMLLENFTNPWTKWAHQQKSITKNQAHGSPGNLLDLYAAVDIPECETFGSSYFPIPGLRRDSADIRNVDPDPIMLKFASSAAHVTGKPLISSETFTWLGEHFKTSWSQAKPEVEQVFLSGVNHVFYHGITYSPEEVPWPGWLFYASLNLTPANSLWPHFEGLNNYITRCQSVLQSGQPDNELLVYWPVFDFWESAEGMEQLITVHGIDEWLHPTPFYKQVKDLMQTGYSLDFASDAMIKNATIRQKNISTNESQDYQVLVIPEMELMPLATLKAIHTLASEGGTVIFESLPKDVPGLADLDKRRKEFKDLLASLQFEVSEAAFKKAAVGKGQIIVAPNVQEALESLGIHRESLTDTGLKFIRRDIPEGKYYYLVNHTVKAVDEDLLLNMQAAEVLILDPQTARFGLAMAEKAEGKTKVKIQLQPGEALILKASYEPGLEVPAWRYLGETESAFQVQGDWKLAFTKGGPKLPADQELKELKSWTRLQDPAAEAFSGTGAYTITFDFPEKAAGKEYILNLGQVNESAKVWLNGEEVGILWSIPYSARITDLLKSGENTLKIEVANLMANRIKDMDTKGIEWRKYHEINFVNIDYKPFDASGWNLMPSGLLGPVSIQTHAVSN